MDAKTKNAAVVFTKLRSLPFGITGTITKGGALEDMKFTLEDDIPAAVQEEPSLWNLAGRYGSGLLAIL